MAEGQSNAEQYQELEREVKINKIALKALKDQKKIRDKVKKGVANYNEKGNNLEKGLKEKIDNYSESFKNKKKNFKSQGKNQLDSLVSLLETSVLGTGQTETKKFIRNIFVQTTNRSVGRVKEILSQEMISAIGCSQEQKYSAKTIYIKVSSLDIFGQTLTNSPNEAPGRYLYETKQFNPNSIPRSFNRELYNRIQQQGISYFQEYNLNYRGVTNQDIFNITYVTKSGNTPGFYYKVDLLDRQTGNKVTDFLGDYLDTIDVLNINDVYKNVLDLLTGSISFTLKYADNSLRDQTKFEKIIQRILGICFDNKTEIDVSGVGKLDQLDQVDDNIFELDELDNIEIENKIKNILSGVIEYESCGSVKFPVSSPLLPDLLNGFNEENLTPTDYDFLAINMLETLGKNPEWKIKFPELPNFPEDVINKEFLKLIPIAIVNSIMSPKHLFPIFVMSKALGNSLSDDIESLEDFARFYKKYLLNIVSRILSIYVEELVKTINKELKQLVKDLINQELNELIRKKNKTIQRVLLLINAGLTTAALIDDYRRCQSIIDELQRLLQIGLRLATLAGAEIPPIVNYFAFTKPGMSPTSILKRTIGKMEDLGVPTGDLPDGSPNLGILIQQAFNESLMDEISENAKVTVGISTKEVTGAFYGVTPIVNISGNLE